MSADAKSFHGLSAVEWAMAAADTTRRLNKSVVWPSRLEMYDTEAFQVDVLVAVWGTQRNGYDFLPIKVRARRNAQRPWLRLSTKALAVVCRDEAEAKLFARRYG